MLERAYQLSKMMAIDIDRAAYERLNSDAVRSAMSHIVQLNPYKVRAMGSDIRPDVVRERVLMMVCDRYATTVAEIVSLEELFDSTHSLPVLINHPLLQKMKVVDYT
jgi:hypothetical protein